MTDSRPNQTTSSSSGSPAEALNRTIEALEARLDGLMTARRGGGFASTASAPRADRTAQEEHASPKPAHEPAGSDGGKSAVSQVLERQRRLSAGRARGEGAKPVFTEAAVPPPAAHQAGDSESDLRDVAQALVALRRELRAELRRDIGEDIGREFTALRDDVQNLRNVASRDIVPETLRYELSRLSDSLELSARDGNSPESTVERDAIRSELEGLRALVEGMARAETVEGLDLRWTQICDLMSEIDPGAMRDEMTVMTGRLDELRNAVAMLPDGESERRIESELGILRQAIEDIAARDTGGAGKDADFQRVDERLDEISRAIAVLGQSETAAADPERLDRVEERLGSIAEHLAESDGNVVNALAPHLDSLAQGIGKLAAHDQSAVIVEHLQDLSARVAEGVPGHAVDEMIEHLQMLSRRVDELGDSMAGAVSAIEARDEADTARMDRFEALMGRAEENESNIRAAGEANLPEMQRLHRQLEDIVGHLDHSVAALQPASDEAFRGLENQIAHLADLLSANVAQSQSGDEERLAIEPRLAAIESYMARSQDDVIEAASRAAQAAVGAFMETGAEDFDAETQDYSVVAALSEDLRSLEQLTRASDERNSRIFDAIHDTLIKIAGRLESLDSHRAAPYPETGDAVREERHDVRVAAISPGQKAAGALAMATAGSASADAHGEPGSTSVEKPRSLLARLTGKSKKAGAASRTEPDLADDDNEGDLYKDDTNIQDTAARASVDPTPPIDPSDALYSGVANEPIEPGSGGPDIGRILQKVRNQQDSGGKSDQSVYSDSEKADFIAAARRAAQAAAAEVENTKRGRSGKSKDDTQHGAQSRRRPILLAVGAVLLAVMSYPLVSDLVSRDGPATDPSPQTASVVRDADSETATGETDANALQNSAAMETVAAPAADNATPAVPEAAEAPAAPAERQPVTQAAVSGVETVDGEDTETAGVESQASVADPISAGETSPVTEPAAIAPASGRPGDASPATASIADPIDLGDASRERFETGAIDADTIDIGEPAVVPDVSEEVDALPDTIGSSALLQAAREGNGLALFEIGSRFMDGRGPQADLERAAEWYRYGAQAGFAPAQYRLGNLLEKGTGVSRDIDEAKEWYGRAAEQGNASAMHNLAVLHAVSGEGGQPDYDTASDWFVRAAEHGVSDSQFNLAILYARGNGVAQDLGESYKWFAIAAEGGDQDAAAKRDEVANVMEAEDLDRARAAVELWQPLPLDDAANSTIVPDEWGVAETRTASVDPAQAIRNVQVLLNRQGFNAGAPDGIMGRRTIEAVKAFQRSEELEPTGVIDENVLRALIENNTNA